MVDVDTDEVLYRLVETDVGPFTESEILTESQLKGATEMRAGQ